jgi:hypothetical protein
MKIRTSIILLCMGLFFVSCGKKSALAFSHNESDPTTYHYERPFAMSTNEKLLDDHVIIKKVDLYELIPDLDTLPLEKESFFEVYDNLKLNAEDYSKYVVLKKTAGCMSQIGYCEAYYIKK